jgi:hypothetical protein
MEEIIGGYRVHPAASAFPLIEGDEFDELVGSICRNGIQHPIVVRRGKDGDELLDGRNRLRAAAEARERGCVVDVPVTEWTDDGRNVSEWIFDTNALRRHLTEDAWVLVSASINKLIRAENEERKRATQFQKGTSPNPGGKPQVSTKSSSPDDGGPLWSVVEQAAKREVRRDRDARSTVGQVAAKAGVSMHKARQAIAVLDAVEAGEVTPEAVADVKAGKKKLRDVSPKKPAQAKKKHRSMQSLLSDIRDIVAEWKDADHNTEVLKDELRTQLERL